MRIAIYDSEESNFRKGIPGVNKNPDQKMPKNQRDLIKESKQPYRRLVSSSYFDIISSNQIIIQVLHLIF